MSRDLTKLAGQTLSEKRDLLKLGDLITQHGLDKLSEDHVAALVVQAYHLNPEWLGTMKGRQVYRRAWLAIQNTEWAKIIEPFSKERLRELKAWDAQFPDDDGPGEAA